MAELTISQVIKIILGILVVSLVIFGVGMFFRNYVSGFFKNIVGVFFNLL